MALQLRRGTNKERLQITPAEGELIFVTDWELATITGTSIDGSTETITFSAAHGLSAGDQVLFQSGTQLGLTNNTTYFVIAAGLTTTACRLATSSGGSAIDLTTGSALTLTFAKTPTNAAGAPIGTNVTALWIGDGSTVGGIPGNTQGLDDLSDVVLTTPAQGDVLTYDGTDWINDNVIQTGDPNNRLVLQYNNTSNAVNSALVLRKNYDTSTFVTGNTDGTGIRFEVDSNSQATTEYATLTVSYDTAAPEFSLNTSINDGSSYQTAMTASTVVTDVRGDLRVRGNDIKNSSDDITITMASGAGALVTLAGDLKVSGNSIQASDGNTNIEMTSNTLTEIIGDLQVSGNDIKKSGGTTVVTFSGTNLTTLAGDLQINGNTIRSSTGAEAIELSGQNVTINGDLTVNGTTTTIESTTLVIDDSNITIGKDNTLDTQADGGGITLKGASDKTFTWNNANDWWVSNQHLATNGNLYLNANQTVAEDAVVYFGTSASLTNKQLRWDDSDSIFYITDTLRSQGNLNAEGDVYVNGDFSDDNAVIYFRKPTTGSETLQWNKTANRFEFSDTVYASGTLSIDGDSLSINADDSNVDSYLYFKGTGAYIKYDYTANHYDVSANLKTLGDLEANGNLYINIDGGAVDSFIYANGTYATPTAYLKWDNTNSQWQTSHKLSVQGDLLTEGGGDLYIDGDTITLNNGNAAATCDIVVDRGASDAIIRWNESTGRWTTSTNGSTFYNIPNQNLDTTDSPSFAGVTGGNIRVGVTGDNEIDTSSGGLTLDSASGTVTVDDDLTVSGDITHNGTTATFNNNVTLGSSNTDTLTVNASATFNEGLSANNIRVGVTGDNEIDTSTGNLTIDSAGGTVTVDDNLTVSGDITHNGTTATFNNNVTLGSSDADTLTVNATASFNNNLTVGSSSADTLTVNSGATFNEGLTANNITVGISTDNTIATTSGDLAIAPAGGDTNITGNLDVTLTASARYLDLDDTDSTISIGSPTIARMGAMQLVTTTSTTTTDMYSWSTSTHGTVEFLLQATSAGERQSVKGMIVHDGTDTWINTYSDINTTSSDLFTVSATITGSTLKLQVTSASATSTAYKGSWNSIAA